MKKNKNTLPVQKNEEESSSSIIEKNKKGLNKYALLPYEHDNEMTPNPQHHPQQQMKAQQMGERVTSKRSIVFFM